jgi:hypothetical protein
MKNLKGDEIPGMPVTVQSSIFSFATEEYKD